MTAEPCQDMHLLVQAEIDGELDASQSAALAVHLSQCPDCAALAKRLSALSSALRTTATRHRAPGDLRRTIGKTAHPTRVSRRPSWAHGASFGLGLALAACIAIVLRPADTASPLTDIVSAHIRGLQPGHLVDVASTDQHTVKPWFDGRLDYAPPVHDFSARGFPLVGGRLDYLDGRPVAVLVYRRDRHVIDVFVWPGDGAGHDGAVRGYHVAAWAQGGMMFRAVSDLNVTELGELEGLIRK